MDIMSQTETITVNVDENVSKRFRKAATVRFGKRKGYLGKAFNNAMKIWTEKQENENIDLLAIEELKKGYNLGGLKYKNRSELHER